MEVAAMIHWYRILLDLTLLGVGFVVLTSSLVLAIALYMRLHAWIERRSAFGGRRTIDENADTIGKEYFEWWGKGR
jgi:hypothetical protein